MELTVGKITNKDIAEWMGITANTFNKNKDKYLSELNNFAIYHIEGKKVVIDEVLNPVYSKQGSRQYQMVRDKVDEVWSKDGLDTCARVGSEIYEILSAEDNFTLQNTTVMNYTRRGRNELYGKPFIGGGKVGNCVYLWCKRDAETGEYSMLNEDEQRIKQDLQTKYFGDATEKQVLVKGMVEAGEITRDEAWGVLEEMTNMSTGNFMGFLKELQAALGCQVVKGTLVERTVPVIGESAF